MHIGPIHGVRLLATATAFPTAVSDRAHSLNNVEVLELLGHAVDDALLSRAAVWGVAQRQWLHVPGRPRGAGDVVDLAEGAVRGALQQAGVRPDEVDAVFLATSTPSHISSSAAARLVKRLGIDALSIELRGGGAGALQGLALACTTPARCAVVVAAEVLSATLDPTNAASALLYADGAAAVVLCRDEAHPGGLERAQLGTASVQGRPFTIPGTLPPSAEELAAGKYTFQRPDRTYLASMEQVWDDTADRLRAVLPPRAIVAPYPVTRPAADRLAARLGVPWSAMSFPLAAHGCVGSAGVLVALDAAVRGHPGRPLAMVAVGGGVTWGVVTWQP